MRAVRENAVPENLENEKGLTQPLKKHVRAEKALRDKTPVFPFPLEPVLVGNADCDTAGVESVIGVDISGIRC